MSQTEVGRAYGNVFCQRATGTLPEMDSRAAFARHLASTLRQDDSIVDVGCGAGHYYASLRKRASVAFTYHGIDATDAYIARGREAFAADSRVSFQVGDAFALPVADQSFDVACCCNVVLHLPSARQPLSQLIRVARRQIVVRLLVGPTSYVVQEVMPDPDGEDFDDQDEPPAFHFLNIYSERYLRRVLQASPRVANVTSKRDRDFRADCVSDTRSALKSWGGTRTVGGMQVSGMIVLPWTWLTVDLI